MSENETEPVHFIKEIINEDGSRQSPTATCTSATPRASA
jgi:hypothetical protein